MAGLFNEIKSFFNQFKFNNYANDIRNHLNSYNERVYKLSIELDHLNKQKYKVSDEQINHLKNKCSKLKEELYKQPFYAVNDKIKQFVNTHQVKVQQQDSYIKLANYHASIVSHINQLLEKLTLVKDEVNLILDEHFKVANHFLTKIKELRQNYITFSDQQALLENKSYPKTFAFFAQDPQEKLDQNVQRANAIFQNSSYYINQWNKEFVEKELKSSAQLFNNIDGKTLDIQQRTAIVTDENNNLVLAGAGSGKTLTISGKVKYLVEKKQVKPEDILLISFTRKASDEMYERIANRLGVKVDVKTFHKLGLEIITSAQQYKPDIFDSLDEVIEYYFKKHIFQSKSIIKKLLLFFGFYLNIPKDFSDFDSLGEYHEHQKTVDLETFKGKMNQQQAYIKQKTTKLSNSYRTYGGERVKSLEEVMIANFLFLNGIEYQYEQPYPFVTANQQYRQYKPDFYLPKDDIYIEHFGVNEQMRTPQYSEIDERQYLEGMEWKRDLHKENDTTLIETYSFYNKQGILLEKLEESLKKHHVDFKEVDFEELFHAVYDQTNNNYLTEFKKLVKTFINLFKSNGYQESTFDTFHNNNKKEPKPFFKKRNELFFDIVRPIYHFYQSVLKDKNEIDFNDMINTATELVKAGRVSFSYKYIIIDEYQDISKSRFNLINEIREKNKAKIMCVGDDWQSIYRFAGSDIQLFTKFGNYFGQYELLKIEKTYRNSQQLIDIAGQFVMKNPQQYKKDLKSDIRHSEPIQIVAYQRNNIINSLKQALDKIVEHAGETTKVMLLGRNNFDIQILDGNYDFKKNRDNSIIEYQKYPKLKISFLTVHRSKGLEADHVILINAKNSMVGFPNQISDDPILSWVLTDSDSFWFAEERRLFYVAMTRTKNTTYILSPDYQESTFVKELKKDYKVPYITSQQDTTNTKLNCPRCKTGILSIRETNRGKQFVGCSNFPGCDYTINSIDVMKNPVVCDSCGGYMIKRRGKGRQPFYGCTNYPTCRNTKTV